MPIIYLPFRIVGGRGRSKMRKKRSTLVSFIIPPYNSMGRMEHPR